MAKNVPGATFVSKGIKYILNYGPKGNLRPYTFGPLKTATKTRNPYIIMVAVLVVATVVIGLGTWEYRKRKKS